jgi:hypothetical protein
VDCADPDWRRRLGYLATRADLTVDEGFLEYFLGLVAMGCLDDVTTPLAANGSFWDLAHGLVEERPDWAARFIGTYVRRRMALPAPDRQSMFNLPPGPFDGVPDPIDRDLFETVGRTAPGPYLAEVLPIVLDVISARSHLAEDGRLDDPVWSRFRIFGSVHGVNQGLLAGLEEALSGTARFDEHAFRAAQNRLVAANSVTADDLLARAFTAVPDRFASEALAWIEDNPCRLEIGYTDSSYWRGRELVAALWPQLDHSERTRLEALLLAFYPRWERSREGRREHGHAQFVLLDGLPSDELSPAASRRVAELRRKFGTARPPRGVVGGAVPSPIPAGAVDHMTDEQWIGAMRSYTTEEPMRARSDVLSGGMWQVSSQLRDEAKKDSGRFVRLAAHLPPDVPMQYINAVLEGAASSDDAPREELMGLIRLAHALPGRPCGRAICDAVARHADPSDMSPDIVAAVTWYAVDGPEAVSEFDPPLGERGARMGLLDVGLNTDRGRAASAIARLVNAGSRLDIWKDAITGLASDHSDAVRASAAEPLLAALRQDRDWVAGILPSLLEGRPDVASSVFGELLLKHLTPTHPQLALRYISELVASPQSAVARVGGRLAALAALTGVDAPAVETIATHPSAGARLGLAEVCAANIADAALAGTCRMALLSLIDDPDAEVRREVGSAFRILEGQDLRENTELITSFVAAAAFAESPDELIRALVVGPTILPDESLLACHRVLGLAGAEAGSLASSWSARMPDVAALAMRVYVHGPTETRSAALDVIDRLAVLAAYGYERALQDIER